MNMREKKKRIKPSAKNRKEKVRQIQEVLSRPVKRLGLSAECLYQLSLAGFADVDDAERKVNERLFEWINKWRPGLMGNPSADWWYIDFGKDERPASTPLTEVEKSVCRQLGLTKKQFRSAASRDTVRNVQPFPDGYKRILNQAVEYFGPPFSKVVIHGKFLKLGYQIIGNTDPKEINDSNFSKAQKEWLAKDGIKNIDGVLGKVKSKYGKVCAKRQFKWIRLMNNWLKKNYPQLHEFYLHGRVGCETEGKIAPSMIERLKSLDQVVKYGDLAIIEIALSQLKYLIENDILFASVFYRYFYKQPQGSLPDQDSGLKRKALKEALPYVYYLKFFKIQPILWNGIEIRSIYDRGVLLLNALAGEKIYSEELVDPVHKHSGPRGKLIGSDILCYELSSFRRLWGDKTK
jgi:hypothetical protein